MSFKKRLFHTLLFETIALILLAVLAVLIMSNDVAQMSELALTVVDHDGMEFHFQHSVRKIYEEYRISRTLSQRIQHGFGFELGILVL